MKKCKHKNTKVVAEGWSDVCLDCGCFQFDYNGNWHNELDSLNHLRNNEKYHPWLREHILRLEKKINDKMKNPRTIQNLEDRMTHLEKRVEKLYDKLNKLFNEISF